MKIFLKYIVPFIFCISMLSCFVSCDMIQMHQSAETTETTETEEDMFSFDSVYDLIIAIKKNPSAYGNEKVTVQGTIFKQGDYTAICDISDVSDLSTSSDFSVSGYAVYRNCKKTNHGIDIEFYNDISYAVVTTGDYVELSGTVKTINGEIILDNCECEIIKFASERK